MILFRLIITCMVAMPCHKLVEETLDETQFDCICNGAKLLMPYLQTDDSKDQFE